MGKERGMNVKNYKDMSTDELKNLQETMKSLSANNDNAKKIVKVIAKEIKRRSN
jgi:hypothetical protein